MTSITAAELARIAGDWTSGGALYADLAVALAAAITDGRLPPGIRLPAERALAAQLGISRNTVVASYQQLRERRLARTRQGSGTVVAGHGVALPGPREARVARSLLPHGVFEGFLTGSGGIDLRAAYWVGADELPAEAFDLDTPAMRTWLAGHGYFPAGIPPLRDALAAHLTAGGLPTSGDQVMVTSGGQQALALLVGYLVDPGDRALVEDPTYPGIIETLLSAGAVVDGVHRSTRGLDLQDLRGTLQRRRPRLVYLVPTAHNPLGTTLDDRHRAQLVEALRAAPLVVDDMALADTELHPTGARPLATYADGDTPTVVTVGSLSKSMWGGLRIGWLRAPAPLVRRLTHVKAVQDIGTPVASQVIALRLLDDLDAIRARRRANIGQRLAALEAGLAAHVPSWRWLEPHGGLSLWVSLGDVDAVHFSAFATRYGVATAPGTISSPTQSFGGHLRLPYGHPPEVLRAATERLGRAWRDYDRAGADPVSAVL